MSDLPPDPWKTLGVDRHADKSDIRASYKKLVLKCHPDKVQDPTLKAQKQEEFQKVQQAWELLNDDEERTKYEEKVKLMELRKQAAMMSKNMPNSSAARSPSSRHFAYEIRTAEPRHKSSPSGGEKVYAHYTTSATRSHEEMSSQRIHPVFEDGEKHARRTASYEKPSRRDEERRDREREERRRKKDEDEQYRIREREREKERERERELREREREQRERERELRRAEKKRIDKEREILERQRDERLRDERLRDERLRDERLRDERLRDKDRRRDAEEKSRRHKSPYIEDYERAAEQDDAYISSKSDKKRSTSKRHTEPREREREREKSTSRRELSPHIRTVTPPPPDQKLDDHYSYAANYISASRKAPKLSRAQTTQDTTTFFAPPVVPTPPPAELFDDSIMRSANRAAGRRFSHDTPKSRDKSSSHKQTPRDYDVVGVSPSSRQAPMLHKSYTTPPVIPEPHISRSNTNPLDLMYGRQPPTLSRGQTWAPGGDDTRRATMHTEFYDESDDDRERRRRSRRTQSPEPIPVRYKVDGNMKTSRLDTNSHYGISPPSRRYPQADTLESRSPSHAYSGFVKVKESKAISPEDVAYTPMQFPYKVDDPYSIPVAYA
ncbi:hypothetical protein B0T17DRAFT_503726 [Bombardia bombarda]|uniref:J domain-containing protein n=1 Tax=Bombardia bombarda TaxID=252184 RepID=A0AA39XLJ6_9PEZI|nr:hypothetical protein B0T17DRAFT_503726 [Bombardia bombarda]